MLQGLREKLSKLSVRLRSRSGKRDKNAADDEHDALETTVQTLNPSPRPATLTSPSSPSILLPSPSLPPSSPSARGRAKPTPSPTPPSSSAVNREYARRERRLSARAVLASVVHSYKPKPRNQTKLTSLPPELLLAIFAYLQGDPTRPANVAYRGASAEPDRWYSHDWSLMQAARTCRRLRALAGPMLYSRAALIDKEDFLKIARLREGMRARIRHLTVSIAALEQLYVELSAFATSSFPAFPHIRLFSPPPSLPGTQKPYLRGTPFAPCFARTQLISLTLFRPDGVSARSGDAVLPGFAEFFVNDVLGYWRALESLHVRDARGVWSGDADMELDMTSMRTLEWDIAIAPPLRLEYGLRALTLGEKHVPSALPAGLRSLRTRSVIVKSALPDSLETLHVLPSDGLAPQALRALTLPRLSALRDLRIALESSAALESLTLPAGMRILQLHLPTLPAASALARLLQPLVQLLVLSLVLPASVTRSPSPTRAICETHDAHAAHFPLASALLASVCTLHEVHIARAESEACVWGRPSWVSGEGDVVWLGAGEWTLLNGGSTLPQCAVPGLSSGVEPQQTSPIRIRARLHCRCGVLHVCRGAAASR